MKRRRVVAADDAVVDLEQARAFYECQEQGLGDYFTTCLLSDLESLAFFGGVHALCLGFHRALARRFPFAIYDDLTAEAGRCAFGWLDGNERVLTPNRPIHPTPLSLIMP